MIRRLPKSRITKMIYMDPFQIVTGAAYAIYAFQSIDLANQHFNTRRKAEKYWQKENVGLKEMQARYQAAGKDMPMVSLIIPARNESDVIRHTIDGISEINYPKERMELSIVTDEKEDIKDLDDYLTQSHKADVKERMTTLEIAREAGQEVYQKKGLKVNALSVPVDFDGYFPGRSTGRLVKSTKGRANNYALGFVSKDAEYIGVYDADARPDLDVLLGVAGKHLKDPSTNIMQGPIFQIGNYENISLVPSKTISLYQSVTHDWTYPLILEERKPRMPFIGGTNYVIKQGLLKDVEGFDPNALSEDWDLGMRTWMLKDAHANFLPYPAIEQTPPTFKDYFTQRKRWRLGGIQVYKKAMEGDYDEQKKKEFRKWNFKNELSLARMGIGAVASPWPAIALAAVGRLPDVTGSGWPIFWGFTAMNIPSVIYPSYLHEKYSKFIDGNKEKSRLGKIKEGVKLTLSSIPSASLSAVPWIYGGIQHALGKDDGDWVKTPRTKGSDVESQKDERSGANTFFQRLKSKGMEEEDALKKLLIYSHNDPKKTKFYEKELQGIAIR